jgi:hypothetical protein
LSIMNFESSYQRLPVGSESKQFASAPTFPYNFYRWSLLAHLTPYLDQSNAYNSLDLTVPLYAPPSYAIAPQNQAGVSLLVPLFLCPSDRGIAVSPMFGPTNYAGCAGTGISGGTPFLDEGVDGTFYVASKTQFRDLTDGLSNTAILSESTLGTGSTSTTDPAFVQTAPQTVYRWAGTSPLTDATCNGAATWNVSDLRGFSWANGEFRCALYNHYYPPNGPTPDCLGVSLSPSPDKLYTGYGWRTARSQHTGGAHVCLGDGSVRFVSSNIDLTTWRSLGSRAGGEILGDF